MSESVAKRGARWLWPVLAVAGAASANPRPLPFTYPYESLPKGGVEVEQFVDLTPVVSLVDGVREWSARYALTTEIEYGITDRLELGLYLTAATDPGAPALVFDGIKQRLRYRFVDAGQWPIDVAIYGELAELHDEIELEVKLNLQRRFGPARLMVNLSAEHAWDFKGGTEWTLNPSAGVAVDLNETVSLGVEYWMHAVIDGATSHYLGPTLAIQWRKLWVSVGPYLRLDNLSSVTEYNDKYGRVWVRTVIGLNL